MSLPKWRLGRISEITYKKPELQQWLLDLWTDPSTYTFCLNICGVDQWYITSTSNGAKKYAEFFSIGTLNGPRTVFGGNILAPLLAELGGVDLTDYLRSLRKEDHDLLDPLGGK